MTKTKVLVCVLFALTLFFVVSQSTTAHRPHELAMIQLPLQTVPQGVGIFVSAAACLALLLKTIGGANLDQLVPFFIPLFAGLLLIQVHWALVMPLVLVILGVVVRPILEMFRPTAENS